MHNEYHYVVSWLEEDQCYVGRCPDLFLGGVHSDHPDEAFRKIRELADWVIETHIKDGKPLPTPLTHLQFL